jgi:ABC-type antimicrobial peptide transport system permease subunit
MRFKDALILSTANFRLRRKRTIITIATISILFGLTISVISIAGGLSDSLQSMSSELFKGKTYLIASKSLPNHNNPETFSNATNLYNASQNPNKQNPISTTDKYGYPTEPFLDPQNEFAKQAIDNFLAIEIDKALNDIKNLAKEYDGTVVSTLETLKIDGNNISLDTSTQPQDNPAYITYSLENNAIKPLILKHPDPASTTSSIPILAPVNIAALILDIPQPPRNTSSPKEKIDFLRKVTEKAPGTTFSATITQETGYNTTINYEIVGLFPSETSLVPDNSSALNPINTLLETLRPTPFSSFIIPRDNIQTAKQYYSIDNLFSTDSLLIEFSNVASAKNFQLKNSCAYPNNNCSDLLITEFLTNQISINNLVSSLNSATAILTLILTITSTIIMIGTLSRIADDERQIMAVYRSVGASKKDIIKIFLLYVSILCLLITAFAIIIGYALSAALNAIYSHSLTISALIAYQIPNSTQQILLVSLNTMTLSVLGAIFATGFLSTLLLADRLTARNTIQNLKNA